MKKNRICLLKWINEKKKQDIQGDNSPSTLHWILLFRSSQLSKVCWFYMHVLCSLKHTSMPHIVMVPIPWKVFSLWFFNYTLCCGYPWSHLLLFTCHILFCYVCYMTIFYTWILMKIVLYLTFSHEDHSAYR